MESEKPASPIKIFSAFFRLGLTAFGGPAMVAYIRRGHGVSGHGAAMGSDLYP